MADLPAGAEIGLPQPIHAIDGDEASLCEQVAVGMLVKVDDLSWPDIARANRCPGCQALMTSYGMGHL